MPQPPALLTVKELAARYRVSESTARSWAVKGKVPSVKTPGGQFRFAEADVDAALEALTAKRGAA